MACLSALASVFAILPPPPRDACLDTPTRFRPVAPSQLQVSPWLAPYCYFSSGQRAPRLCLIEVLHRLYGLVKHLGYIVMCEAFSHRKFFRPSGFFAPSELASRLLFCVRTRISFVLVTLLCLGGPPGVLSFLPAYASYLFLARRASWLRARFFSWSGGGSGIGLFASL